MKKKAHVLGNVRGAKLPKWVIFFDTETTEHIIDSKNKELKLKLGYATLTRRDRHNRLTVVSEVVFYNRVQFTRWLGKQFRKRERYYIVAHNVSFDVRITSLFEYLQKAGFTRTSFIEAGLNFIGRFKRNDTGVVVMNNMQFFNMTLKKLGQNIGFEKGTIDFEAATDAQLVEYCKRDVHVMVEAWNKLIEFVSSNDLGNFGFTLASQSMTAFRHRFMHTDIMIHDNEDAIKLERESYHGGRVEMHQYGQTDCGPVYYVDVNSMYPYVMREYAVPTKLVRYFRKASFELFERVRKEYGYIAEVTIDIEQPILPVVHNGKLCFPVGRITGVFAKPELEKALSVGKLISVGRLAAYKEEIIFKDFVDFFYMERLRYKKEGNDAFALICKLFLNSLYGKFGQRNLVFTKVGLTDSIPDGFYETFDTQLNKWCKYRIYKGVVERETGFEEGYNSFVAIASYVTSLARVQLYEYMELAGLENTLYCDTDSLFVNSTGYMRLLGVIEPSKLGMLKVEGISADAAFYGAKRYKFGDMTKSKGIRSNAVQLANGAFEQDKWMGFKGALRTGNADKVIITKVTKQLHDSYSKGIVLPSGRVAPFRLPLV